MAAAAVEKRVPVPCLDPLIPLSPLVTILKTPCDSLMAWCQIMDCLHALFLADDEVRPMTARQMRRCFHTLHVNCSMFFDKNGHFRGAVPGIGSILGSFPINSEPITYTEYGRDLAIELGEIMNHGGPELPTFRDAETFFMSNIPRSVERVNPTRQSPQEMWGLVARHCFSVNDSSYVERRRSIRAAYTALFNPAAMVRALEIFVNNAIASTSLYTMFPWVFGVRKKDGTPFHGGSFFEYVPAALSDSIHELLEVNSGMDSCGLKLGLLQEAFHEEQIVQMRNVLITMIIFVAAGVAINVVLWSVAVRSK